MNLFRDLPFRHLPFRHLAIAGLLAGLTVAGIGRAQARAPIYRSAHAPRPALHESHSRPQSSSRPPYAEIVVDDNSGQVLFELNPDEPRHPASLTKIMTLYLLFEQLDAGKLKPDTPLQISAKAALHPPTKLGLKAGQTITVEDAIAGLATRSANDAAAVVAEAIGGSEEEFAQLMTRKAKALGMINTTYVNASGLPDEAQITTARDQSILGRAIRDRFPGYYRYFSIVSFRYNGHEIHNHNGLLGNVEGVDGIKTGYTDASGHNLVASVRRGEKHIVAVVLGGTSNAARDTRMRQLIEENIRNAATQRTAPPITEAVGTDDAEAGKTAPAASAAAVPEAAPAGSADVAATRNGADQARPAGPTANPNLTFVGESRPSGNVIHDGERVSYAHQWTRRQAVVHAQPVAIRSSKTAASGRGSH
jgi:D-alanyl-D-alanine carboxypeptidase